MTDTGAPQSIEAWIGVVPEHWGVEPLGRWFRERKTTVNDVDFVPLSVTMQGIVPQLDNVAKTDNNANRKLVLKGDFAINSRSDRKGSAGVSGLDGSVSVITTVLQPRGLNPRFTHHLLRSRPFQEEFYRWGHGIVDDLWSTKWSDMKSIKIPVPPEPEQRAIADYLDRETAQIDAFIAKNEDLITLLTERRAALIDEALVRAGANVPAVPLKRSVDFVTVGIVVTPAKWYVETGIPALRGLNVKPGLIAMDDLVYLSDEGHHENRKSELRAGDVLVIRTAQTGAAAVVPANLDGANAIDLLIVRTGTKVVPEFLAHFLNSDSTSRLIAYGSVGSIQGHFNVGSLRELPFPLLPRDEQWAIVRMLDEQAVKIDQAIETVRRGVGLARERRGALISAAVTGKIDVGVAV